MNAIILKNVTKRFGELIAVRELNFEVPEGSIFGLLGPNGAGKSTTIRMITNIIAPDSGEILFQGQRITSNFHKQIGYLPEERGLYNKRRIVDQLVFFGRLRGLSKEEAGRRADEWLARLELSKYKKSTPAELSKGMRHKVQFISAAIHDPAALILDEPFSGLDPISVSLLKEVIFDLKRRGRTIIFSSHQMEQVEQMCDIVCLINRGTKVLGGELQEIKSRFRRKSLLLGYSGTASFLDNESYTLVNQHSDHIEVVLDNLIDAQKILQRALSAGAVIHRFQMIEPTLNDIFIDIVGEKNGKDKGDSSV